MGGGDYGVFIWSAYGVTGAVVLALLLRAVLDYLVQSRKLARLETGAAGRGEDPSDG